VDVGGFAEPRKILCQCVLPSYEQISVHPRSAHGGAGIPNILKVNSDLALSMKFMHIVQYLKLKGWSQDGSMLGENFILLQK